MVNFFESYTSLLSSIGEEMSKEVAHYIVYKTRPEAEITEYYYFVTGYAVLLS